MNLQELAEKHCDHVSMHGQVYGFALDQLSAMIREVVGHPVAFLHTDEGWKGVEQVVPDRNIRSLLYEIQEEVLK